MENNSLNLPFREHIEFIFRVVALRPALLPYLIPRQCGTHSKWVGTSYYCVSLLPVYSLISYAEISRDCPLHMLLFEYLSCRMIFTSPPSRNMTSYCFFLCFYAQLKSVYRGKFVSLLIIENLIKQKCAWVLPLS